MCQGSARLEEKIYFPATTIFTSTSTSTLFKLLVFTDILDSKLSANAVKLYILAPGRLSPNCWIMLLVAVNLNWG